MVSDELRSVLIFDQGLVFFLDGDAVELLRVVIDAIAEWIILAKEDALLRAQVNRYLRACYLLRNKCIMSSLLQCPPSIHASDPKHYLLKPFSQCQSYRNANNILLSTMRVNNDVLIQLRNRDLPKFPHVHRGCIKMYDKYDLNVVM